MHMLLTFQGACVLERFFVLEGFVRLFPKATLVRPQLKN